MNVTLTSNLSLVLELYEFCVPCPLEIMTITKEYRALKHLTIQNLGRGGNTNKQNTPSQILHLHQWMGAQLKRR